MSCPRCGLDAEPLGGRCTRCNYAYSNTNVLTGTTSRQLSFSSPNSGPLTTQTLMRGDALRQGRYRLVEPIPLPENQQGQGTAWLARDAQASSQRVIIREIPLSASSASEKEQELRSIALRLADLAQYPGFPKVKDMFSERGFNLLVFPYPEGDSLAALLKQQGGVLPERLVAEIGRQLCVMLSHLTRQQPPVIHGSLNPETIFISPLEKRVSLLYIPIFPINTQTSTQTKAGYQAPEQARGTVGLYTDVYGIAATLHHAVTGYDPRERLAFFHPPAKRLNPRVTSGMEAILMHALSLSPAARYPNPSDMLKDLSALIASYPPEQAEEVASPAEKLMLLSSAQLRERSRQNTRKTFGIFAGVCLIILSLFLLVYFKPYAFLLPGNANTVNISATQTATAILQAQYQASLNQELTLEQQTFQQKGIGLSDGRFIFDTYTGRSDVDLKMQVSTAIQKNDLSTAVNLLTQAVTSDPTDGEAQIYNEDLHILQSGAPYVTIVLGLAVDNNALDFIRGRIIMQGAFLAQHEVNTKGTLPHNLKLRILIDNSGADKANVAEVAQFVANRVIQAGNLDHIIAVVGWPFSSQTTNARDIIAGAHLPLVSQTASSVKLSGSSPYFFRVNPADDQQGITLGAFAVQQLHAKNVVVLSDSTDPYSVSLANAFATRLKDLGGNPISNSEDSFKEGTTTVAQYQTIISNAITSTNKPDLIFLAGFDVDAIRLANAVGNLSRANSYNTYLANLKILGGDGLATSLILGQGDGPDAALAASHPEDIQRLIFTAFGNPDEWNFLKIPQNQQPDFFANWATIYQSSPVATNNAPPPANETILTYDAFGALIDAATLVKGSLTGQAVRDALTTIGKGSVPAYQGVSGRILFNDQGNPVDKAVVVLDVEPKGTNGANTIVLIQVAGTFKA